ncbi:MAG: hypothetical protein ACFS24_00610, partial [Candidatus Karelsulcia muelleri]
MEKKIKKLSLKEKEKINKKIFFYNKKNKLRKEFFYKKYFCFMKKIIGLISSLCVFAKINSMGFI